jgi:hypothetical protein
MDIPRPFDFKQWGKGEVVEEAAIDYEDWAPAVQVLEFENGQEVLRFCYYAKSGKLAPRALNINDDDITNIREEIKKNPRVRKLLQRLLE